MLAVPALPVTPVAQAHDASILPGGYWGPLLSCTGNYNEVVDTSGPVTDTCDDFCDLLHTGQHILNFTITIVLFIGVPVMLVWGGVLLMISVGAEERRSEAKGIIKSALIGTAIVVGGYVILNTFLWIIGNGTSAVKVSWPNIDCSVAPYVPPGQTTR